MELPRVGDEVLLPDQRTGETFDVRLEESLGVGRLMVVHDVKTGERLGIVLLTTTGGWWWVRRDEPDEPWTSDDTSWRS